MAVVVPRVVVPVTAKVPVLAVLAKLAVPVKVGAALKTSEPVPVSLVMLSMRVCETAVVVALDEASRKRARLAAKPEKVMVEVAVRPLNVAVPAKAGLVLKTEKPVPVSSERRPASCDELVKEEPLEIPSDEVATHCTPVPVV